MDLLKDYPQIIINDRLQKPDYPGDYKTPENMVPKAEDVEGLYWESCMSIGSSWGYKSWDTKWKSPSTIVNTLISIASLGGNLLLNVGPDAFGIVRQEESGCLEEVGKWMSEYGHIIYGSSRSGMKPSWGKVIRKDEGRRTALYLCVDKWPDSGELVLEGNLNPRRAQILQNGRKLSSKKNKDKLIVFVPQDAPEVSLPGTPVIIRLELNSLLPVERLSTNSDKIVGNQGVEG
jgi:alpha-L-fucosidase